MRVTVDTEGGIDGNSCHGAQPFGVVMAGGHGNRLRESGVDGEKALLHVGGQPLIQHSLDDMVAAGITQIGVVSRPDQFELHEWLEGWAAQTPTEVTRLTQKRPGTLGAVLAGLDAAPGVVVLSTCDVIAAPGTVAQLLDHKATSEAVAATLATTRLIHDKQPIWVKLDGSGRVADIGKEISATGACFGHVRVLFPSFAALARLEDPDTTRDTLLLGRIARQDPQAMVAVECGPIIDVDEAADIPVAEALLAGGFREP